MSIKISAMPAATPLTGAELVPVVQGGANKSTTPSAIAALVPAPTAPTQITQAGGAVSVTPAGAVAVAPLAGQSVTLTMTGAGSLTISVAGGPRIVITSAGLISMGAAAGQNLQLTAGSCNFILGGNNTLVLTPGAGNVAQIYYKASTPGNWLASNAPTDIWVALDRLAAKTPGA